MIFSHSVCFVTEAKVLYECGYPGQHLQITCPFRKVIKIFSAGIHLWRQNTDGEQCVGIESTCTLSPRRLHGIITVCNNRQHCEIEHANFSSMHCERPTPDQHLINRVKYACVNGRWKCLRFQYYFWYILSYPS